MHTILKRDELERLVRRFLPAPKSRFEIITCDNNYVMCDDASCAWFCSTLSEQVQQIIGPWKDEYRNCNKFARLFQALAAASHARGWIEQYGEDNGGLAVGTLSYRRDDGINHMVVLMLTKVREQQQINVRIFEPQNGLELFLSDQEKNSAFNLTI